MKLTTILLILCIANGICAQKNLVFKQVKLVTTSQNVPTGHVWKVENVGTSNAVPSSSMSATDTPAILINGSRTFIAHARTTQTGTNLCTGSVFFPIWLPAGTSLAVSNTINFISVIEFIEQDL